MLVNVEEVSEMSASPFEVERRHPVTSMFSTMIEERVISDSVSNTNGDVVKQREEREILVNVANPDLTQTSENEMAEEETME
jgi:hypothetical protein